jgi:hypothetical protein
MKTSTRLFSLAAWCLILFGLVHELTFVYSYISMPAEASVVQAMKHFPVKGTPKDLYSFYNGYALMMGLLLVGIGVMNLTLVKTYDEKLFSSLALVILEIVVSLIAFAISTVYFAFIIPVALTGAATILLMCVYFLEKRKSVQKPQRQYATRKGS